MKIRGGPEQEYEKWQVLDKLISFQVVVGKCNPGVAWMNMPQVINESGRDTEPTSSLQIKAESTGQSEGIRYVFSSSELMRSFCLALIPSCSGSKKALDMFSHPPS